MKAWFAVLMVGVFVLGMTAQQNLDVLMSEEWHGAAWWKVWFSGGLAIIAAALAWYAAQSKETEEK